MFVRRLRHRVRRFVRGKHLPTWYDPRYRLPMASIEARMGIEPRRADYVLAYLLDAGVVRATDVRTPERASYLDLGRVHTDRLLESLFQPETLAAVFAVEPADVHVEETILTLRLACGATVAAAREALTERIATLNLLGGFHHAEPDRAGSLCALNDIAIAIAALRSEGMAGRVAVLDFDAHPPDGTAACLKDVPDVWIGSISGSSWGPLGGVDETVLPGAGDERYLDAVHALLARMPRSVLAFVIAGGDVLSGDRLGALALTLSGARARDRVVARALQGIGSVWLPGGGYHPDAWKVLAGSALAIAGSRHPIADDYDAMRARYARIAGMLDPRILGRQPELGMDDILADLGVRPRRRDRLLDYYTPSGIEHALERYGVLDHLRRLGYDRFEAEIGSEGSRDRARLYGQRDGVRHLLIECVLEKRVVAKKPVLYVHWLTMQDAARKLDPRHRPLPGQEHPGLGLSREMGELFTRMAERLGLAGVAFTPSWYHMAYVARHRCRFVDPARQGRFEALVRDLQGLPLAQATAAVAEGRVELDGRPYAWEADDMVTWLDGPSPNEDAVRGERERVHFRHGAHAA